MTSWAGDVESIAGLDLIRGILLTEYGEPRCSLDYENPLQLLVAAVLSAQCFDVRVNAVTPELFARYPSAADFADAVRDELERIIRPLGFFRAKAANIIAFSRMIVERFDGKVPRTMAELTSLPGVGRKTANVVLGNAFGRPGFPVDTHVRRILNRLGVVDTEDPVKIESRINALMPPKDLAGMSHLLIAHGRACCRARKPKCADCAVSRFCDYLKGLK